MKTIFQAHNQKILSQSKPKSTVERTCDCQKSKKDKCPLKGKCMERNVVYQATTEEHPPRIYIGSTEAFKARYTSHKYSFRHESHRTATTLSQHVWDNKLGTEPRLNWDIVDRAPAYNKGGRHCSLCLTEKLHIMLQSKDKEYISLNRRTEIAQKCRHRAKFRLSAVK